MSKANSAIQVIDVSPNEELPTLNTHTARSLIGVKTKATWNKHLKALGYYQEGRSHSKVLKACQVWDLLATHLWGKITDLRGQEEGSIEYMVALIRASRNGKDYVSPALAKYNIDFKQEKENVLQKWQRQWHIRSGYATRN